jgi:hypothetical protein
MAHTIFDQRVPRNNKFNIGTFCGGWFKTWCSTQVSRIKFFIISKCGNHVRIANINAHARSGHGNTGYLDNGLPALKTPPPHIHLELSSLRGEVPHARTGANSQSFTTID